LAGKLKNEKMEKNEISLKTIFGHLWEGVLPHRRLFWVCVAAFVVFQLIELAIPVFYKRFFDELGQSAPAEVLIGIITVIAVINLANWLFIWPIGCSRRLPTFL